MFVSLGLLNYYTYGTLINSIPRGLSVVAGLSNFRSVHFGRFYCIIKTPNCLGSYTLVFGLCLSIEILFLIKMQKILTYPLLYSQNSICFVLMLQCIRKDSAFVNTQNLTHYNTTMHGSYIFHIYQPLTNSSLKLISKYLDLQFYLEFNYKIPGYSIPIDYLVGN